MSRIRTSLRTYPKLLLTAAAVGGALAGALVTSGGAPGVHPATAQHVTSRPATAAAVTPATSRPTAFLDAAAISQRRAAERTAQKLLARFGWGKRQWTPLYNLWNRESGWNKYAENPYSGAYGIPQALPGSKMASAGADWQTNPATQIRWGLGYIRSVYGSPCSAWSHEEAYGWY